MIKIENLSYSFPQKDLFNNISFTIERGSHCAFIGTSGSGKTTLLKLILDQDKYMYSGQITIEEELKIGYVNQFLEEDLDRDQSLYEYIAKEYLRVRKSIDDICNEMEKGENIEELLDVYQNLLEEFDAMGGDDFETKLLKRLNMSGLLDRRDLSIGNLSGGELKLSQIIREMSKTPDLLIMDEPDGFLDFEHINALKDIINEYKGILIVITHNRYLLNHCFDKIIHLENTELQEFDGNYADYNLSLLQKKIELMEMSIADDEEIARHSKIVDRHRFLSTVFTDASRGKSLKARKSLLERLEKRRIKAPFVDIKEPQIKFKNEQKVDECIALKVSDFSVTFDELLLENINFEIKSNEKVALIGANGTGKTTLFREILKNNKDAIMINENLVISYLSQTHNEIFDEEKSILLQFLDYDFDTNDEVREYLKNYGFEGEGINQQIKNLSGGEKNILQIAKIAREKSNFLLLDEPTSHLDLYAQVALEKALKNYDGAVLMVSHDYYSIINSMDYVLLIEDKSIRKMTIKKFKRMIYADHFNKNYLELEDKKKSIEIEISKALKNKDFEKAAIISEELENIIELMK